MQYCRTSYISAKWVVSLHFAANQRRIRNQCCAFKLQHSPNTKFHLPPQTLFGLKNLTVRSKQMLIAPKQVNLIEHIKHSRRKNGFWMFFKLMVFLKHKFSGSAFWLFTLFLSCFYLAFVKCSCALCFLSFYLFVYLFVNYHKIRLVMHVLIFPPGF